MKINIIARLIYLTPALVGDSDGNDFVPRAAEKKISLKKKNVYCNIYNGGRD